MKILLIGPPGCGKGTQANLIINEFNIPQISTGDMLRKHVEVNSELGIKAKSSMDNGELVSDNVILGMMRKRLIQGDCKNGYILDGFPRTIPQAIGLDALLSKLNHSLDKVIVINVTDDTIVERMGGRRVHPASGRIYHIKFNPPKINNADDITGGKLIIRRDDEEKTVRKRLGIYHNSTSPLISYYSKEDLISIIDGNRKINEIFLNIKQILNND